MSALASGLAAMQAGDIAGAVRAFESALAAGEEPVAAAHNLGVARARTGDRDGAEAAFLQAVAADGAFAPAWAALGLLRAQAGVLFAAEDALRTALAQSPDVDVAANLGAVLREQGRPSEAAAVLYPALKSAGTHPIGWNTLGAALQDLGDLPTAAGCFQRAAQQDPRNPVPLVNLHGAIYDDQDPASARRCLEHAAEVAPTDPATRFHLGCLWGLEAPGAAARHHAVLPAEAAAWRDSWRFVLAARDDRTRFFGTTAAGLRFAASIAREAGLVVELGVRFGTTLSLLRNAVGHPVHGFDTFEGLPEAWHSLPAGSYSTGGQVPGLGPGVELHRGLFADTLPPFLADHAGPLRLAHVDCDLYSAAAGALEMLAPRVIPGTVLVFDEYLMNARWREDEHRALVEVGQRHGWSWRYAAFSMLAHQAVVEVTAV
ncbi:MAG: class I SAM-dependent methyltransferase [Myxococcota bacterium]|nr:class I SAM-dependent methyltransferase [Myxococcota bacterium]